MNTSNQKLYSIELLRGIAAWAVVMHHYNQVFFKWDMSTSLLGGTFGYLTMDYGKLGVDIFFVISGFIITITSQNHLSAKDFFIKRCVRVIPAYWFFSLLLIPLCYVLAPENVYTDWDFSSLLQSFFFIPNENPSVYLGVFPFLPVGWTLNFEMFFYSLFSVFIIKYGRYASVAVLFFLLIVPSVWPASWIYSSILSSPYLYQFAAGIIIALIYMCKENGHTDQSIFKILCCAVFFLYVGGAQDYKFISVPLLVYVFIFINPVFFSKTKRLSTYLGSRSYAVYLAHPMVLYLLNEFGKELLINNEAYFLLIYIISIVLLSELSVRVVESIVSVQSFKKAKCYAN